MYDMASVNAMNRKHDNKLNNMSECHLLHDILNPSKITKNININFPPNIHACMNIRRDKTIFKEFLI